MTAMATPAPDKETQQPADELAFRPSSATTLGVELEMMILDRDSGDLAPGAVPILKACATDPVQGVSAELMQSMIEIKTEVCASVAAVKEQLWPNLRRLNNIARSLGYDLAISGTHPFHRTTGSVVFPAERYERIMDRLAWLTYQRVVFGLHVHVGVPGRRPGNLGNQSARAILAAPTGAVRKLAVLERHGHRPCVGPRGAIWAAAALRRSSILRLLEGISLLLSGDERMQDDPIIQRHLLGHPPATGLWHH